MDKIKSAFPWGSKAGASTPAKQESFKYTALSDTRSIRILRLESKKASKSISCTLLEVNLEDNPVYEALSYTWGDLNKSHVITCSETELPVTKNLAEALSYVRHEDKHRYLWIDQICIDQTNLVERNNQVSMMGQIYKGAKNVIVWLGPPDKNSSVAIPVLKKIGELSFRDITNLTQHSLNGVPKFDIRSSAWEAIFSFCHRPWFQRAWVLQEVALARSVEAFCGEDRLTWGQLTRAASHLAIFFIISNCIKDSVYVGGNISTMLTMANSCRSPPEEGTEFDMKLLFMFNDFIEASDPRDMVYSQFSLGADVQPDYSITYETVYTEATRKYLSLVLPGGRNISSDKDKAKHVMSLLSCCAPLNRSANLPSWVPDWSYKSNGRSISCQQSSIPVDINNDECFNAGGSALGRISLTDDHRLVMQGRIFDTVTIVGVQTVDQKNTVKSSVVYAQLKQMFEESGILLLQLPFRYPSGELRQDAYKRTLFVGHLPLKCRPTTQEIDEMHSRIRTFFQEPPLSKSGFNAFFSTALSRLNGRLFFLTQRGFMGIARNGIMPGSQVCILKGARAPYIVKETPRGHRLLGDCYLHGIMEGEAMGRVDSDWQDISLV